MAHCTAMAIAVQWPLHGNDYFVLDDMCNLVEKQDLSANEQGFHDKTSFGHSFGRRK
jgi:hypothetical protein